MAGVFVGGQDRFRSWKTRLPVTFLIFVIGGPILGYFVYSGIMTGSILLPLTVLYLGHLIIVMAIYVIGGISAIGSWLIYNIDGIGCNRHSFTHFVDVESVPASCLNCR